jgi:mono/diheme cytochrome c family protein
VESPFGTIYGTNITPDPETGIGRWSLAAFTRAMREGVSRDGHHLYPAFPYDHYQRLSDADLAALYAFLMTRDPVRAEAPANKLFLPLRFRPFIAGWKLLFFRHEAHHPDPRQSAAWNRGAYLGEGLAHCGGCHSPRGLLGAEKRDQAYDGGWSAGWYAPPLNRHSPAVRAWTADRLERYFRTGLSLDHAAAAGPMGSVTHNLGRADPNDVRALAAYYAWQMRDARAASREPALADRAADARRAHPEGYTLFAGACASCHEPGAPMMVQGRPPLPLGTPLHEAHADDTVNIILHGLEPPVGRAGPYMPAYADAFTDAQVAEIVRYLRARYGSGAEWKDIEETVAKARERKAR